jgi:hypothetical protein
VLDKQWLIGVYLGESDDIDSNVGAEFCADLNVLVVVTSLQECFLENAHLYFVCVERR